MTRRTRTMLSSAARCESLERRMLLSLSPTGAEFRANSFTTSGQNGPAVASDADGDFVVVWEGSGSSDGNGIFAQRYNAAGVAQGSEFRVNTTTALNQRNASVAMDADGDFVVAWESKQAGTYDVFAQRFNAAGAPQGSEFRANTFTTSDQLDASVAIDAAGDFVIAWTSIGQEGVANRGIYAQRYNLLGQPQGGELHVNTVTANNQLHPAAAMDADGDFMVTWFSYGTYGIFAQRYNAAGVPQGGQIQLTGIVDRYAVAMDGSGDFVLTWDVPDGSDQGVFARRFNAAGIAQGGAFAVNTVTANAQQSMAVAIDAHGNFLITWESDGQDGSNFGVYGQDFNAAGVPQGSEFRVNTFTTNRQRLPAVAMDADGDAVIAWQSLYQDSTNSYGVYAQRYGESNPDTAPPMVGGLFFGGKELLPGQRTDSVSPLVVSFSENMSVAGGSSGLNSASNRANYRLTFNGADISAQISSASFAFSSITSKFQTTLVLPSSGLADGSYVLTILDNLRDPAGNALDGDFDGVAGAAFTRAFSVVQPVAVGPEFRVNSTTNLNQETPAIAIDAGGNFIVVWRSEGQDGSGHGIYRQAFNGNGAPISSEFLVNSVTTNEQANPAVAKDADGAFVVAWDGLGPGDTQGVFARRFQINGLPADAIEFKVNTVTTFFQGDPAVAMDAAGDFVIAWTSTAQDGSGGGIFGQRYNAAGAPMGPEFLVNTTTAESQGNPAVAMDSAGDFVIVWESHTNPSYLEYGVFAQRYNAAGVAQGGEFHVTDFAGFPPAPCVAMNSSGDFVVAWEDDFQIKARHYFALGASSSTIPVDITGAGEIDDSPAVGIDSDGDFIVAWHRNDSGNYDVYARRYDRAGSAQGNRFLVNTFTAAKQTLPAIAMHAGGDFVIAWQSSTQDGSDNGIYAQRYARVPEVNISRFLFQTAPHRLQFTFNDNVSPSLGTDDIVLQNLTTSTTIPSNQLSLSYDPATQTATFSYTGNASGISSVLPNGNYRATLLAAVITNPGGTPLAANQVFDFFFLNGDANHDRMIDVSDLGILATNWQGTGDFSKADFNLDGHIDVSDLGILATNWQKSLPAASPPASRSQPVLSIIAQQPVNANADIGRLPSSDPLRVEVDKTKPDERLTLIPRDILG